MAIENLASPTMDPYSTVSHFARRSMVPLSVVLALRGSESAVWETIETSRRYAGTCELELIVVHNGSLEGSQDRLQKTVAGAPHLSGRVILNPEGSDPRNTGIQASKFAHVLILDDGGEPVGPELFQTHASLHSLYAGVSFVVMGDVLSHESKESALTFALGRFLTGSSGSGAIPPSPRTFLDYRYFSGTNISIKKSLVGNWAYDGFRSDLPASVAALEFAYRVHRQRVRGLQIFYDPNASVTRANRPDHSTLMALQVAAGGYLKQILERYPDAAAEFGLESFATLTRKRVAKKDRYVEFKSIIEGIKAGARLQWAEPERNEPLTAESFFAVLEVCLLQGLVEAWFGRRIPCEPGELILERFRTRWRKRSNCAVPLLKAQIYV